MGGPLDVSLVKGSVEVAPLTPTELDFSWRPSAALVATALGRQEVVVPGELGASVVDLLSVARQSSNQDGMPVKVHSYRAKEI